MDAMRMKPFARRRKNRSGWKNNSGQVMITMALTLPVLCGMMGLAIDAGYMYQLKQQVQAAADAAAIAGAVERPYGSPAAAAKADAKRNGFEDGKNNVTVTVNNPPLLGPNVGKTKYVEVIVKQDPVPTFFMKVLGKDSYAVQARAVGFLGSGPTCMYSLSDSNTSFKLTPGGAYAIQANCGIVIDSSSTSALQTNGCTLTATSIGIVGGCSDCGSNVTPSPRTGIMPVPDPLAYLPNPTPQGPIRPNPNYTAPGSYTLNPGIFTNGLTIGYISGQAGPDVTFAPGEYYITGGSFTVTSPKTDNDNLDGKAYQHPNLHGSNVFIYIGPGVTVAFPTGNQKFANSYGGLVAPTAGTFAGILFYQARGNSNNAVLSSGHGDGFTGTLYFPSAALKYSNSRPNAAKYMIFVAQTLDFYRDMAAVTFFNSDYSDLPDGSPTRTALLAE